MRWKPIKTAPTDETEIIVGCEIAGELIVRSARFVKASEWLDDDIHETDGWWSYRNSVSQEKLEGIYEPTHWLVEVPDIDPS